MNECNPPRTHHSLSFPPRKSWQLGQLQLKTAAPRSRANHREKALEETLEVFLFCELGMKPEKLEGKSAAVRGKGGLLLLFYFKHMYYTELKHGSEWYLQPEGKSYH